MFQTFCIYFSHIYLLKTLENIEVYNTEIFGRLRLRLRIALFTHTRESNMSSTSSDDNR